MIASISTWMNTKQIVMKIIQLVGYHSCLRWLSWGKNFLTSRQTVMELYELWTNLRTQLSVHVKISMIGARREKTHLPHPTDIAHAYLCCVLITSRDTPQTAPNTNFFLTEELQNDCCFWVFMQRQMMRFPKWSSLYKFCVQTVIKAWDHKFGF